MAGEIKISALPLAGPAQDADVTAGVQSGTTVKQTNSALSTYISAKINLNTAYANTTGQNLTISSGLNLLSGNLNIGTSTALPSALLQISSISQGFLMPTMTAVQMNAIISPATGLEVYNTTANAPYFYNGSAWVPSDGSSLTINGTANQINVSLVGSSYTLSTPQNINTTANFQAGTLGVNLASTLNPSAVFEADSTTQGILIPRGTITQRNAISSPANGLQFYDTTSGTIDYFDGTAWQQGLAIDRVNAGTNITLDDSIPGQLTINASGGGTGPTAAYASWVVNNNSIAQSIQTTYFPINIVSFSDQNSSDFTNQLVTMPVSLFTSPVSIYNGSNTQFFSVVGAASCLINTVSSNNYYIAISILKANNTIVTTPFVNVINLKNLNDYQDIPVSGIVELSTGDGVFYSVKADNSANLNIKYVTSLVTNIPGSIPSTDGLSQGTSNIYLSQNGGTTYQNVSGTITSGNLPEFSGTSGLLVDSGVPASLVFNWVVVTSTTQTMSINTGYIVKSLTTVTFTLPPTNSGAGSIEVVGTGRSNWIINVGSGQYVEYNGYTTTVSTGSVSSGTPNDSARIIYGGDGSGEFDIELSNGMALTLT
jgi:hypothetical protein